MCCTGLQPSDRLGSSYRRDSDSGGRGDFPDQQHEVTTGISVRREEIAIMATDRGEGRFRAGPPFSWWRVCSSGWWVPPSPLVLLYFMYQSIVSYVAEPVQFPQRFSGVYARFPRRSGFSVAGIPAAGRGHRLCGKPSDVEETSEGIAKIKRSGCLIGLRPIQLGKFLRGAHSIL